MSHQKYAFLIGVLLVWFAWTAGWVVLAAIAAGLVGLAVVRVVGGDVDLGVLGARARAGTSAQK